MGSTGREINTEQQQPYPAYEHGVRPGVLLYHKELVPDPASLGALQHLPLLALLVVPVERGSQVAPPLCGEGLAVAQHTQAHQGSLETVVLLHCLVILGTGEGGCHPFQKPCGSLADGDLPDSSRRPLLQWNASAR